MIRIKAKKILLVAPEVFSEPLIGKKNEVKHVTSVSQIFPVMYDMNPDLIVFDYEHLGPEFERILRRIRTNSFYNKTKICCYKPKAERKTDSLLQTLGVNYFLHETVTPAYTDTCTRNYSLPESISMLFKSAVLNLELQ
ncbi:hypothetical protein [Mucilaginibacter agri]|uniref:Uncharacterized protein n=1 Tax=Mucilaginibacter agri TaxID=2695265 RepID=A0A965ZFA1_9SPHI|nr:hypothetical protein [Mucilaginibacter agri]NCD68702.1 hypothetical protein [Mucilaginibacter agri]